MKESDIFRDILILLETSPAFRRTTATTLAMMMAPPAPVEAEETGLQGIIDNWD